MKKLTFAAIACFIFAAGTSAQTVAPGVPVTEEGREIFDTLTKWADAVRDRNTKALNDLFEEGLIITTPDGKTRGKTEELEILKPNPQIRTRSIKNEDVMVRVFGQTAVATGLNKMHMVNAGKDVQIAFRYTAVFLNKDGRWQLVALHTARPS